MMLAAKMLLVKSLIRENNLAHGCIREVTVCDLGTTVLLIQERS